MLTEKRHEIILQMLKEKNSISVTEIKEMTGGSDSTIRRDLTTLDKAGKLSKVFGGAVSIENAYTVTELSVAQKQEVKQAEKRQIARYAAQLIKKDDFIYLDAGTTTGYMIEYLTEKNVTFVTNAVDHAKRLAIEGFKVLLIGGELKGTTEAIVGSQAVLSLQKYHFTKGFLGRMELADGTAIPHQTAMNPLSNKQPWNTAIKNMSWQMWQNLVKLLLSALPNWRTRRL